MASFDPLNSITRKARNLHSLAKTYPVPRFTVVTRDFHLPMEFLQNDDVFIVRSCLEEEDGALGSLAGQGISIGPLEASEVIGAIETAWSRSNAKECIVQVFEQGFR